MQFILYQVQQPDEAEEEVPATNSGTEGSNAEMVVDSASRKRVGKRLQRPIKRPRKYCDSSTPKLLAGRNVHPSFSRLDVSKEKKFMKELKTYKENEYIIDGYPVSKSFFMEISKPRQWVESNHMDALTSLLWGKLGDMLIQKRIVITDTFFTRMLCREFPAFNKCKNKGAWSWNNMIRNYVRGIVPGRFNKLQWYADVDTLYAPMNWGKKYWIGLVIDLLSSKIIILDPLHSATVERKMISIMDPFLDMLSAAVNQLVPSDICKTPLPTTFVYERVREVSQNNRAGDCGPFSIKFMELHCQDVELGGITEKHVDNMRTNYAFDLYEEYVKPLTG